MLVTSRSFEEYEAFFSLASVELAAQILDCSAGASGFAAVANARGGRVTAVDPAYGRPAELVRTIGVSASGGAAILAGYEDRFVWTWYGSRERRDRMRSDALEAFLTDFRTHPGGYVPGALPELPFADHTFDLALCSHLLFTWSDVLGEVWHGEALSELLRVAREVRVFPLVVQGTGDAAPFLSGVLDCLRQRGHRADVVQVPYEFQRGANEMLKVVRG